MTAQLYSRNVVAREATRKRFTTMVISFNKIRERNGK